MSSLTSFFVRTQKTSSPTNCFLAYTCHDARGGVSKGRFPSRTGVRREFSPLAALWLLSCRNKKVTALPPGTGDVLKSMLSSTSSEFCFAKPF